MVYSLIQGKIKRMTDKEILSLKAGDKLLMDPECPDNSNPISLIEGRVYVFSGKTDQDYRPQSLIIWVNGDDYGYYARRFKRARHKIRLKE